MNHRASQPLMVAVQWTSVWFAEQPSPILSGIGSPLLGYPKGSCVYNVATEGDLSSVRIESMESQGTGIHKESTHSVSSKVSLADLIEGRNFAPWRCFDLDTLPKGHIRGAPSVGCGFMLGGSESFRRNPT